MEFKLIVSLMIGLTIYIVLNKITQKFVWDEMTPMGHEKKTFIRYVMKKVYIRDLVVLFITLVPILIYFEVF